MCNSLTRYIVSLQLNPRIFIIRFQHRFRRRSRCYGILCIRSKTTGFEGLIIGLKSLINLTYDLINTNQLKLILSYKFSQDYLEMLFSPIRAKGGFNNNPTVNQFEATYKAHLVDAKIKCSISTNCLVQDSTSILRILS